MGVSLESLGLALPLALVIAVAWGALGWITGDLIWRGVAAGSGKRVRSLANRLTHEASRLLPAAIPRDGSEEGPEEGPARGE